MRGDVRLRIGPCSHHLPNFKLCHLVLPECDIVDEETSAELVCDSSSDKRSPCNAKDHIEGDTKSSYSTELVMSAQVIDSGAADCQTIEKEAEGNVSCILLLLLREHILVWLVLELSADCHCLFPDHFVDSY